MEPVPPNEPLAAWKRKGCLSAMVVGLAFVLAFGLLLRFSRGRGRLLETGLRAAALVVALAVVGAVVRAFWHRRGRGPTPREIAIALLGIALVLVFMWFVMMFG